MTAPRYLSVLGILWLATVFAKANPMISNVTAEQQSGTRNVLITYDLATPEDHSVAIDIKVSTDGGNSFIAPAVSFTGDYGNGIVAGTNRQIIWNAGMDIPGVILPLTQFRLTATELPPSDNELDADTLEFFNRSTNSGSSIAASARRSIDDFVRECKRLGYWSSMVFVPCRDGYGAMNTLGGSPYRTNTPFVRQGTTTLGSDGLSFIPGNNYGNRVQTPFNWSSTQEPVFVGVIGHTATGPTVSPGYSFLRYGTTNSQSLLGTYNVGPPARLFVGGYSTPTATSGEFFTYNSQCSSVRRPNLAGAQFDGSHTLKTLGNQFYSALTHATATTGRPGVEPIHFLQAASETQTHVVQACVLFYGDVATMDLGNFWPTVASTFLSDHSGKYVYVCQGGQSNADLPVMQGLVFRSWQSPSAPLFHYSNYRYGGQLISYWIGDNPNSPQRLTPYESAKQVWITSKPSVKNTTWDPVYFWIQGESDTELEQNSHDYLEQLENFAGFLRQDLRSDLIMAVAQIDYAIAWRTLPGVGNFEVSNCAGTATAANGTYTITPMSGLANSFTDYSWSNGDLQLTRDGGVDGNRWRIKSSTTTYYEAVEDEPHPFLVSTWSSQNGAASSPTIGQSRTGRIEQVRKAQRDFVKSNPYAFTVDTRGLERGMDTGGSDFVHMTTNGYDTLSDRFAAAFAAYRTNTSQLFTKNSASISVDTRTDYQIWATLTGLPPAASLPLAIPYDDGVTNLQKYSFNMNASQADNHTLTKNGNSGLPFAMVNSQANSQTVELTMIRRKNDSRLSYEVQFSGDLNTWISVLTPKTVATIDTNFDRVTFEQPASLDSSSRVFGRVLTFYSNQ